MTVTHYSSSHRTHTAHALLAKLYVDENNYHREAFCSVLSKNKSRRKKELLNSLKDIYKLKASQVASYGKIRKFEIGDPRRHTKEITVLVVGATGTGKTTWCQYY